MARVTCKRDAQHDLLVYVVQGKATLGDLTNALERASGLGSAQYALWNAIDGDLAELPSEQLEAFVPRIFAPSGPRKCAILCDAGRSLAAATAIEAVAAEAGFCDRVRVFLDRDSSLDWLGVRERRTTPPPSRMPRTRS
ncbi:MAG: hypothetical protein JW751_07870 [Polyangiaceae bacterium]|nr:hypothetical protein [Polyangiaceae bacterium]